MSCRTRTRWLLVCSILVCAAVAMAQAPATIFQLNGDAANAGLTCAYGPCDYWNLLNGSGGTGVITQTQTPPTAAGNWSARTFINGTASTDSFTGGGSKDPNPISQWRWSGTPTPNKDTLNAGYAAGYNLGDFDVIFGADRLSPNGDANIGIWFFQQNVQPVAGGTFSGAHQDHDIFVISSFTGGGGTSGISVFEWDHTCASGVKNPTAGQCADSNLRLLAAPTQVCGSSNYCAITNSAATTTSWEGSIATPLFFEGGVDVTQALAAVGVTQLPCFTSFLEETRSSQSTSAVLKDFLAGGFPVCGLSITKSCGTASVDPTGNFISYGVGGTVKNTGVGTLANVSVTDLVTYQANSTHDSGSPLTIAVTPSTLGPGATGTWSTTLTSSASSVSDVATASGSASGTTVTSDPSNNVTCQLDVNTTLKITKNCSTTLVATASDVQVQVAFNGTVCNTGASSITGLALTDFQDSSTAGHAITTVGTTGLSPCTAVDGVTGLCNAPAGACTNYSGSYIPNTIDGTATFGRFFFNDEAVITGATPAVGTLTKVSSTPTDPGNGSFGEASASCPICDKGECVQ
jgi:hypothetical protein